MKTERVIIAILAVLVLLLGYLQFFGKKPATETVANDKPAENWHTNSVVMWQTNTIERWQTNTVQVMCTNTVVQPVTNEVIKEVAAKLTPAERQAATVGYKYMKAPTLADGSDSLYKVSPISVSVAVDESARSILGGDTSSLSKKIEEVLRARNVPVAAGSPYSLRLTVGSSWRTDVPRTALLNYRLELTQNVALQRQDDLVQCGGTVWSTGSSQLARTVNAVEDVSLGLEQPLEKFCKDYLSAKQKEKELESKIPALPSDFLSER